MKKISIAVLCLLTCSLLFSQDEPVAQIQREVPPPPVVSGLTATVTESKVTLEWFPAPTVGGLNIIVRDTKPITSNTLLNAQTRAKIDSSQTTYIDDLEDGNSYYYAILSQDPDGTLYEYLLPASNSLLMSVSSEIIAKNKSLNEFSNFGTVIKNDSVIISWTSLSQIHTFLLYRSTSPFKNTNSLSQAVLVSSFKDTGIPFIDYPVPGVSYYYAILDDEQLQSGNITFEEGKNTSIIPVEILVSSFKYQRSILPSLRPIPLPSMTSRRNQNASSFSFSKNTESKILYFTSQQPPKVEIKKQPYVFSSDISATTGGEDYVLYTIITKHFPSSDWVGAISSLNEFLAIRRSENTIARAHFYLGQSHYFTNNFEKALVEFLLAQDSYENQAREWIRYTLVKISAK